MFKTSSFRSFNRPNGRRRSQNNDTMTLDTMFSTPETSNNGNSMPQRLTKPRTNTNSASNGKGETSSARSTPNNTVNDYPEDARLSISNDSPLSFTGSASFYPSESPSSSATNLSKDGIRSRNPSSASANSAQRHSVAVDSSDVDVASAIALLQELKKRASPEDLILLHKALLPTRNAERAISPNKPEIKENDEPLSPLIRRSSLLPAGVKTRLSRELLRNFSDQNVSSRSNSREPAQSPRLDLLNFEALDLVQNTTASKGGRPVTPGDFDFPQIGTYKIGSLRITNGSASPEPSLLLDLAEMAGSPRKSAERSRAPESVTDGFVTADEGDSSPESARPSRAAQGSSRQPRRSMEQGERRVPSDIRARSKSRGPARRSSEDEVNRYVRQQSRPRLPQGNSEMALEYAAECDMPTNPRMSNPALNTTVSRLSTVHDESPVEEGASGREAALRRLNGETHQSGAGQRLLGATRPPMHAKSDSGYSSGRPRSIVKESHVDEFLLAALDAADQAERTRSNESPMPASSRPSLEQQRREIAPMTKQISSAQKAERHLSLPNFFSKKSVSSTSVNTIATAPVTPPAKQSKKLQKSRPQSQHRRSATQSPKDTQPEVVPAVPEDLSINFSRRINRSSVVVDQTPQTKPADEDNDRRGRGRSRKQDPKSEPASAEASPNGTTRRRSIFRFRSRSRSKSQHRRQEEPIVLSVTDEPLPTFSDFGTVAQSLGQSPYDIATRRIKQASAYDASKPLFHPHEISRALPERTDSSDEKNATWSGRDKSRERTQQDARARSQSCPRGREQNDAIPAQAESASSRPPTRGKSRRSKSAHAAPVSQLPEVPKKTETEAPTLSRTISRDGIRVGTIDFGNGVAQGRLTPILTSTEKAKTRRRTQSVSPRTRYYATTPNIPEEPMPSMPQSPSPQPPKVPVHEKEPASVPPIMTAPNVSAIRVKESMPVPQSPASPTSPSTKSGWESQALAWRERKQSIGEMLTPVSQRKGVSSPKVPSSPIVQAYSPTMQAPRRAPTVVVSRYVTPQGSEFAMHLGEDPYKDLHMNNPTDLRPPQDDVARTDSSSTYRTANSEKSQDSFVSNDSAKYRAYRPTDAAPVTRTTNPAPQDRAEKMINPASQNRAEKITSPVSRKRPEHLFEQPKRRSTAPVEDKGPLYDRYSGGLAYGWERGSGFGGSAGTRAKHDAKASRKSVVLSENYGVDLSDIPVFLVRQ